MKKKLLVAALLLLAGTVGILGYLCTGKTVADSTAQPPYSYGSMHFDAPGEFLNDLARFGRYFDGAIPKGMKARRVMPVAPWTLEGWDYIAYDVDAAKLDSEINRWKRRDHQEALTSAPRNFSRAPEWWPSSESLEPIVALRTNNDDVIEFQQIFVDRKTRKMFIYNDWGN